MNPYAVYLAGTGQAFVKDPRKKAAKHIKRAIRELKKASKYGEIKLTLSEEQLRQIDEARARGDEITATIGLE